MFKRSALLYAAAVLSLLALAASASAAPGLMVPSKLEFGAVDVHFGGTPRQSLTISNMSSEEVSLGMLAVSGRDASDFRLTNDGCSYQLLSGFSSCSLEVEFQPGTRGEKSATLEIHNGESIAEVALTGTGATGTLSANPGTLQFSPIPYTSPGTHEEGEQNEQEQITISDSSDAGVQNESVSITGPDASSFSIAYGNCGGDLMGPSNTCDEEIRFQPTSAGPKDATLVLGNDGGGGTVSVPLEGEGREGPRFSPSTTQALLGNVELGASRAQTFTITNSGDYSLYVQKAFLVSGTPLMFPRTSDTCSGQIIEPGASCEITVLFKPTTTGQKDGALLVITNATPGISVLGLDGTGVERPSTTTSPPALPSTTPHPKAHGPLRITPDGPRHTKLRGGTLTTGVITTCPGGRKACQALSVLTTTLPIHTSATNRSVTLKVLGSASVKLREKQSTSLHVHLTAAARALLKRRGHLSLTLSTVLRAGAVTIATHTRTLLLTA